MRALTPLQARLIGDALRPATMPLGQHAGLVPTYASHMAASSASRSSTGTSLTTTHGTPFFGGFSAAVRWLLALISASPSAPS